MVRIDSENLGDKNAVEETLKKHPQCSCGQPATIWIRPGGSGLDDELFICDDCAFQLARIIINDLGHPQKIVRDPVYSQ